MDGIYAPPSIPPMTFSARTTPKSSPRPEKSIFGDTDNKNGSVNHEVITDDECKSPRSKHAWLTRSPMTIFSNSAKRQSRRVSIRRDGQKHDTSPTAGRFPFIRPFHKRKRKSKIVLAGGHSLRRNLSTSLLHAYEAARAQLVRPLTPKVRHQQQQANHEDVDVAAEDSAFGHDKPHPLKLNHPQISAAPRRPKKIVSSQYAPILPMNSKMDDAMMRTLEVPSVFSPTESGSLSARLFRQISFKSPALNSPLFLRSPIATLFGINNDDSKPLPSLPKAEPLKKLPIKPRDSFNKAKKNVRRPPKGITHWFEAVLEDLSDENTSPKGEVASNVDERGSKPSDYFSYAHAYAKRRKASSTSMLGIPSTGRRKSVIDLSSDEEDYQPRSPNAWMTGTPSPGPSQYYNTFHKRGATPRKGSAAAFTPGMRQSMASLQTTFTSGTIPFMLRVPPGSDHSSATPPRLERHLASYLALTGRPPTADGKSLNSSNSPSLRQSESKSLNSHPYQSSLRSGSDMSRKPSDVAHFVAVTAEELEFLESLRRKRAAMEAGSTIKASVDVPEVGGSLARALQPRNRALRTKGQRSSLRNSVAFALDEHITFSSPTLQSGSFEDVKRKRSSRMRQGRLRLSGLPTSPLTRPDQHPWLQEPSTPRDDVLPAQETISLNNSGPMMIRFSKLYRAPSAESSNRSSKRLSTLQNARRQTGAFRTPRDEPIAYFPPSRDSGSRRRGSNNNGQSRLRGTRLYEASDIQPLSPDLDFQFSEFQLRPLSHRASRRVSNTRDIHSFLISSSSSDISPTKSDPFEQSTILSELDTHDDNSLSPDFAHALLSGLPSVLMTTSNLTSSTSPQPDIVTTTSPSIGSRSPSLTDGASISGNSRSELDTPIKDPASSPAFAMLSSARFVRESAIPQSLSLPSTSPSSPSTFHQSTTIPSQPFTPKTKPRSALLRASVYNLKSPSILPLKEDTTVFLPEDIVENDSFDNNTLQEDNEITLLPKSTYFINDKPSTPRPLRLKRFSRSFTAPQIGSSPSPSPVQSVTETKPAMRESMVRMIDIMDQMRVMETDIDESEVDDEKDVSQKDENEELWGTNVDDMLGGLGAYALRLGEECC